MIINDKSQTDLSGFYIVYKGSVLNESTDTLGINHLLEHLMCKMFKKYYVDFERYSINWNAYTSNNEVVYHMSGLDEYLYKYRHLLVESLLDFNISENDFEKEKSVVIQEYKDTFQDQSSSAYYNLMRKEYQNYGPIGKLQSLEKITFDDVNNYWEKYLSKPTMIINVSKNNEFDGFSEFNPNYPETYVAPKNDDLIYERMVEFKKVSIMGTIKLEQDMNYIDFILSMLSQSFESPFMKELREKRGLTYGVGAGIGRISDSQGFAMTSLITTNENTQEVLDTYKMILTKPEEYLTQDRFNMIKDYYTIKRKKDDINRYNRVSKYILPKDWQMDEILDDMTLDKVFEYYDKYLKFDNWQWITDKNEF